MTAWLMLAKEASKRVSEGYDDHPSTHYSWDSTVPNHGNVQVGDVIVLWDSKKLLGLSTIEAISQGESTKQTPYCPKCEKADVAERKKLLPRFKCWNKTCRYTFDNAHWKTKEVKTYRSQHESAWISADGLFSADELRPLCVKPKSQNSLRELDWEKVRQALANISEPISLNIIDATQKAIEGGHTITTVRTRRGQGSFRKRLLKHFGEKCAFAGPTPPQALDAAHLYSYAANGEHHTSGGLLLRRDLHKLFDLGLIAVNPKNKKLDISEELMSYPDYKKLHGSWVTVPVTPEHMKWIVEHWKMHRDTEHDNAILT
ncbi:hypothetical protein GCM10007147_03750 [Nocardiopsis kunsanensis]|uniref:HNH nuclease domain-containing protein n=1 Tax=Nocardiopsis kunsanensis TaxID=141693 RepID=A0A918X6Y3_9ACTN|nr:HNH endonuclease signature motif containing protein [Nocardiopsis kunsanensis]GHD15872.1 hypothetical protein GCM10007147_03750 [Nocardiopsis kunsanensis]